jgi:hypothetical protein
VLASQPKFALANKHGVWQEKAIQADVAVSAKRNVLKSQLPLIVIAATVCLLTLMWFVYRSLGRSRCDSIFEQTADRVQADLKFIKVKGGVTLGAEKVQELTDSSQKVGIHLKSCCIAQQSKILNADQFQVCMRGAKDYQAQIIQVATNIKEAIAAEEEKKPELARQKTEEAKEEVGKIAKTENTLASATKAAPTPASVKNGSEQEPNNTIPQANVAETSAKITGEIGSGDDVDFFKFQYQDEKNRRDILVVHLENGSTTLVPSLVLHNEDKSVARDWSAANAPGANAEFSFTAEPGKTYFVGVGSHWNQSTGAYVLSVLPQKTYDRYEPNDNAFTATPLQVGQTIEANIMDRADIDSYRVSGVKEKSVTVELENLSPSLQPSIRVLKSDRSIARDWSAANAAGADLKFSIDSEAGQNYFVEVGSHWSQSAGPYKLTVR